MMFHALPLLLHLPLPTRTFQTLRSVVRASWFRRTVGASKNGGGDGDEGGDSQKPCHAKREELHYYTVDYCRYAELRRLDAATTGLL
ncbi:hypothetical protein C8Q73DRAFT_170773 [Cubamyces lactineus]|nr:hypothetical protein C8Q73DRAFT_170773 [Cubamyces lactineus]